MEYGDAILVDHPGSIEMRPSWQPVYDREIELGDLYVDPVSGAEHYVVRYPPGLRALPHRHTAGHTIVVLEGRLRVNGRVLGPGAYCHIPGGQRMLHGPADRESCLFLIMFDGPFDVEPLDDEWS